MVKISQQTEKGKIFSPMGGILSTIWSLLQRPQPHKIIMAGLDAAGKTTLLYKLKLGEVIETIPTIGFNVETVSYKNVSLSVWDMFSQDKVRQLWRHYLDNLSAIIYVVDSSDKDRLSESQEELHRLISYPECRSLPVLVLANKQDKADVASQSDIIKAFNMEKLDCHWSVHGTCAITSQGIVEAFDWLVQEITER